MKSLAAICLVYFFGSISCLAQNKASLIQPVDGIALTDSVTEAYVPEGTKASEIEGVDTSGGTIQLSTFQAKVTILYFYDFDCRHCDRATVDLLKVFHNYRRKGVRVFAVPLSGDYSVWKSYIIKYNLDWTNVMPVSTAWKKLRTDYKLYSIPAIYMLNEDKVVSSKKLLWPEDVIKLLHEKFRIK